MMMNSNEPASDETKAPTAVATDPVGQFLSSPRRGEMTSAEYRDVLGGAKRIIVSQLADSGSVQIGFRWRSVPVTRTLNLQGVVHARHTSKTPEQARGCITELAFT